MALKIVLLALLVCCAASEAQSQGDDTSLPLSYNVTELQGDGATCPNDQLRQETRDNITTNIRTRLQDTVVPLLEDSLPQCPCMSTGRRVAYLDMTNSSHQCPSGWTTYTDPTRACGRNLASGTSCHSAFYPTNGISYSRVCGRVIAYQYCFTPAFFFYNQDSTRTIDDVYLDGVSITHGNNPREHVWSFASAISESYTGSNAYTCPCTNTDYYNNANILIPPFVGDDYFCDTGTVDFPTPCFFTDDPLWDGDGCGPTSTCCEFNNPPWFCKTLPQPTTDDIEVRLCGSYGDRDAPVELIELFVV